MIINMKTTIITAIITTICYNKIITCNTNFKVLHVYIQQQSRIVLGQNTEHSGSVGTKGVPNGTEHSP